MTRTEAVNQVLSLARAEIGYHEKASNSQLDDKTANSGSSNYTKYARDLDSVGYFFNGPKNGYAYCDVFYDWLHYKCWGADMAMKVLCQPQRSLGAGCLYSAQYYKSAGRWHTNYPEPGDQIFFTYASGEVSHTGIVESVNSGTVTTIEGNTSDQVARRSYSRSSNNIYGYGRPRWELLADAEAQPIEHVREMVKLGDKNESVRELQEALIRLGYSCGQCGADGDYGKDTLTAVKKFQMYNGLDQDGIVGNATWGKIDNAIAGLENPGNDENQESQTAVQPEPSTPIVSDDKAIWDRLFYYIGNAYGVAGAIGNFFAESALRSNNVQDTCEKRLGMNDEQYTAAVDNGSYDNFVRDSVGYGLYQATHWSIKQHLMNFAKDHSKSIGDRDMQVDAFVDLLKKDYKSLWNSLKSATSVRQASNEVLLKFERPANQGTSVQNARALFGQRYYDKYAGKGVSVIIDDTIEQPKSDSQRPMLKRGSTGLFVKELQEKLISIGYSCGRYGADGEFGNDTYNAVIKFQKDHALEVDGVVGPMTWKALMEVNSNG